MKKIVPLLLGVALTACGQSEVPQKANTSEADIATVEELAANPEKLQSMKTKMLWFSVSATTGQELRPRIRNASSISSVKLNQQPKAVRCQLGLA